jgi:hypothetical protein
MNWTPILDHLPALPEAILLVGACALMLVDTFVKGERRAPTYWIAQGTLALCFVATLWLISLTEVRVVDDASVFPRY